MKMRIWCFSLLFNETTRRQRRRWYLKHERNIYKLFPFISISIPFIMWQVSAFSFLKKSSTTFLLLLPSTPHLQLPSIVENEFECEIKRRNGKFSHQILMIAAEERHWLRKYERNKKKDKLFCSVHTVIQRQKNYSQ